MPMIYDYSCVPSLTFQREKGGRLNKIYSKYCNLKIRDDGPHVYVKSNGKETALDQHDFVKNAETLTKKSFRELVDSGAIIYKKNVICLDCLKFKEDCVCKIKNLIPLRKLEGKECPKCKEGKINKVYVAIS